MNDLSAAPTQKPPRTRTRMNGYEKLLGTLLAIMTAGLLTLLGWLTASVVELREFAAKGDRFTQNDGRMLEDRIVEVLSKQLPPRWLVERQERLEEEVKELRGEHREMLRELRGLETQMLRIHPRALDPSEPE